MSMMLKGLMAIRAPKSVAVTSDDLVKISRSECREHCREQLSTVVKMIVDNCSYNEIILATNVSKSFVASTKELFGLVRPSLEQERIIIKNLIMESKDFTHKIGTLYKLTGIRKERIRNIIEHATQIERGKEKGMKHYYKYNFDIVLGSWPIACGSVY